MAVLSVTERARLAGEYIAGNSLAGLTVAVGQIIRTLPAYQDEATRKSGGDVYDKMRRDAVVRGNLAILVGLTLQEGIRWEPACPMPQAPLGEEPDPALVAEHERARAVCEEFRSEVARLPKPLEAVVAELMRGAMVQGSKLAEIVWEPNNGRYRLAKIKPKGRTDAFFVVDEYMNLLGFVPANYSTNARDVAIGSALGPESILPPEKALVFTHEEEEEDPRGRSLLEAAYDWWFVKKHVLPAFLKFIVQFGVPSIVGILGEGAGDEPMLDSSGDPVLDSAGNPVTTSALLALKTELLKFQGGSALALGHGSDVKTLFAGGDGKAFVDGVRHLIDTQIAYAMMGQARATMESRAGSRADSDTGKDILDVIVEGYRNWGESTLTEGLARPWVRLNYGEEAASRHCPRAVLTAPPQEDIAKVASAVATLHGVDFLADEHIPYWDQRLGHGARDMRAWAARRESRDDQRRMEAAEAARAAGILEEEEEE